MSHESYVVVTGSSSGIGFAVSRIYSQAGFNVIGVSRSKPTGVDFTDYIQADLTDYAEVERLVSYIRERYKKISVLVHCAGIMVSSSASKLSIESISDSFKVNVISPTYITSALTKNVAKSKGLVVFIGSVASDLNIKGELAYSSTKLTQKNVENFAAENGRLGIKFINIPTIDLLYPYDSKFIYKQRRIYV